MTDLRKAAEDLLEGVEAAIKAGDWKVDGACDPDLAIVRLRQALAQPEQETKRDGDSEFLAGVEWAAKFIESKLPKREWVGLTKEEFEQAVDGLEDLEDCWTQIEAKLKEKNA